MVDITASLKRLGGDANLLREIIQLFFEDSPELLEPSWTIGCCGKGAETERAAHSLRGLASNFDARRAASAAADIESLARAGRLRDIADQLPILEHELKLVRRDLQIYLQQIST